VDLNQTNPFLKRGAANATNSDFGLGLVFHEQIDNNIDKIICQIKQVWPRSFLDRGHQVNLF